MQSHLLVSNLQSAHRKRFPGTCSRWITFIKKCISALSSLLGFFFPKTEIDRASTCIKYKY